ncbi:MAG: EAL domain-containing protein [Rhodanobacteraceae bacterium]
MLNRDAIHAAIGHQIDAAGAGTTGFAVLVVSIRELRQLALRYGSERGAQAEARIALLIRDSLRPVDRAFQSGDETFVAVLPGMRSPSHVLLAVAKLAAAFDKPHSFARGTPPWQARVAIGAALFPQDGTTPDELWRNAQLAADEAQRRGEAYAFHDLRTAQPRIDYQELRDSIESNRLVPWFQPIWQLADARIVGVESLARWTSPTLGPVKPNAFVTFAEQNDLISALTRWSIHSTFRHAAALHRSPGFLVAINLSPRALSRGGVAEQLLDALAIWGLPPTSVIAEVTETALAKDLESTVDALRRLRDQGMRVAIDDFGVGYASITYLSRFPATELKIDMSLVTLIGSDPRVARLVEAIVKFAHNLGLETTAEGIEDAATQRRLTEMGCDLGQGFHLGRPEPAADFIAGFEARAADACDPAADQPAGEADRGHHGTRR